VKKLLCFLAATALLPGCDKPAAPQKWEYKTVELYNDSLQDVKEALDLNQGPVQDACTLKFEDEHVGSFTMGKYLGRGQETKWEIPDYVWKLNEMMALAELIRGWSMRLNRPDGRGA